MRPTSRAETLRAVLFATLLSGWTGAPMARAEEVAEPPSRASVPAPPELRAARERLLERLRRREAPSFAVGVVRGEEIVWEEGLGWADREAGLPATPETRYSVASLSKSITGTGTLVLAAEGRLRLDQTVDSILGPGWLAASGGTSEAVRVSHLLAHTSGIPHLWSYEYPDRPESLVGREALLRGEGFLAAPPGERFLYTNLGFAALAQVIEKAGGAPFQRVMERALFEPLGMGRTTSEAWVGGAGTARGYDGEGAAIPYRYRLRPDGGAGFFTSVQDLLRYARFHLGVFARPVPPRAAAVVSWLGSLPAEPRFQSQRGWGVVKLPEGTVLLSDGETLGGTAALFLLPEKRLAVAVLSNQTGGPANESAVAILSALLPGFEKSFGEAVSAIETEIAAPGALPSGRFEGSLRSGAEDLPLKLDFRSPEAPSFELGSFRAPLQNLAWERGALQAIVVGTMPLGVGRDRTHRLTLTLWSREGELRGIAQEELRDDRPRYGLPHRVTLKAVP